MTQISIVSEKLYRNILIVSRKKRMHKICVSRLELTVLLLARLLIQALTDKKTKAATAFLYFWA